MNMKYYKIYPPEYVDRDFSFNIKGNNNRVIEYFKFGNLESGFLRRPIVYLIYENIFEKELPNIMSSDFYYSGSGILLFSKKFYDEFHDILSIECEFFECLVNENKSDIYALNIKKYTNLLDNNGNFNCDLSNEIKFFARDINEPYFYVVTQDFLNLIGNEFKMQFLELKN